MLGNSITDCVNTMKIWMQPINTGTFAMNAPPRSCVDKAQPINTDDPPASEFAYGAENEIMLLRICIKVEPMFPTTAVSVKMPVEADGSSCVAGDIHLRERAGVIAHAYAQAPFHDLPAR